MRSRSKHIFRWDLDKTYLVSQFESLRGLLAVPFERGRDKVSLPGVAAVIKALREGQGSRGRASEVYFLSASPPQIGTAIREKLAIDGIEYEGITFKDQVSHIVRGRFDALREQIGYKLERLLAAAREIEPGAREFLFGDDWESDPFAYSLYADLLAGLVSAAELSAVLERAGVHKHYVERIRTHHDWLERGARRHRVAGIFILRQRMAPPAELARFGSRLVWFDNYFECALALYARGLIDAVAVGEILRHAALDSSVAAESFVAISGRPPLDAGHLEPVRRRLAADALMVGAPRGRWAIRWRTGVRRMLGFAPLAEPAIAEAPRYADIVDSWSRRGRNKRRSR